MILLHMGIKLSMQCIAIDVFISMIYICCNN